MAARLFWAVLLSLAVFSAATPIDDLKALQSRIFNDQTKEVIISQSTLLADDLWNYFLSLQPQSSSFSLGKCGVNLYAEDLQLDVNCVASLFSTVDAATRVSIYYMKDTNKFGATLFVTVKGNWSLQKAFPHMVPSDSWSNSIVAVVGNLVISSNDKSLHDGTSVQRGIIVDANAQYGQASLFGIERLLNKASALSLTLKVHAEVPLKTKSVALEAVSDAMVTLNFDVLQIPFTATDNINAASLALIVRGLGAPSTVSLSVSATISATFEQNSAVTFFAKGDWSASANAINFAGGLQSPWVKPFKADWLTISDAQLACTVQLSKPVALSVFKITGTAAMVFGKWQVGATFSADTASNFQQFQLVLSNTVHGPNSLSLDSVLQTVLHDTSATSLTDLQLLDTQLTLALSNFDGQYKKGLTISTQVHVVGTYLNSLLKVLSKGLADITFKFDMFIPVFSTPKKADIHFALTAPQISVSDTVKFVDISLDLAVSPSPAVSLSAGLSVLMKDNWVTFGVATTWSLDSKTLTFTGGLRSTWPTPFGVKWLTITTAQVDMSMALSNPAILSSLIINGAGTITFPSYTLDCSFTVSFANNFKDWSVKLSVKLRSIGDVVRMALSLPASKALSLDDVRLSTLDVTLAISSYAYNDGSLNIGRGLTLAATAAITSGSALAKRMAAITGTQTDVRVEMIIPIFDKIPGPEGLTFQIAVDNVPIKTNIILKTVQLSLTVSTPTTISVAASLSVLFKHNAPNWLTFAVEGGIDTSAIITLKGAMVGTWQNVFGLKGISITNAWAEVGFTVGALLKLGMGADTQLGDTIINMNGLVDIAQPDKVFFLSDVENLSLKDLAKAWNQMNPKLPQIDLNKVPNVFDFKQLKMKFAPETADITVAGESLVHFDKGLWFDCVATLLGIDKIDVHFHTDFTATDPDFQFSLHFTFATLYEAFTKYMKTMFHESQFQPPDLMNKTEAEIEKFVYELSYIIPQLKALSMDLFTFKQMGQGAIPSFQITMVVLGKEHSAGFKLNLFDMVKSLDELIKTAVIDIRKLLNLPQCITDLDCPSGQVCSHSRSDALTSSGSILMSGSWQCVAGCPEGAGKVPVFGCVSCLTSAECAYSGSSGPCCQNHKCVASRSGDMCGMCAFGKKCNTPASGCLFGFCKTCKNNFECLWSGVAGHKCRNGLCQ
eukprot:TRINITY_DN579_c0_g3_i1.p1 TRINITY_DN579_c0_g3~~TRINITY_DN579_c0_g3_i1.p1  ORF type:complete len:1178 (+),score=392.53 TRINITY_DN579_c0_g3_i1:62-3595(+)